MSNTDNKHIVEALLGKGIRAYDEGNDRVAIVIPNGEKIQRAYLNVAKETYGRSNRGRDDRAITGDLSDAGITLMNYLKANTVIAVELAESTPRKGQTANGEAVAFEDVIAAF